MADVIKLKQVEHVKNEKNILSQVKFENLVETSTNHIFLLKLFETNIMDYMSFISC